jgi:DNA mismatch repair protein MutL
MRQLFGAKLAECMIAFDYRTAAGRAWGLAATSQESFATPRMVFTFVNGRGVRDRLLARAIAQAHQTLIPRGRHPAVALFVELRAEEVDVNVHPMKTEVRFRTPGALFELVYHALRARLADQSAAPVGADRPSAGGNDQTAGADGGIVQVAAQTAGLAGGNNQTAGLAGGNNQTAERDARPLRLVADDPAFLRAQRALSLGFGGAGRDAAIESAVNGVAGGGVGTAELAATAPPDAAAHAGDGQQIAAGPRGAPIPRYSELRVLGQLFAGYLVLEDDDGLILVDQHAAHERVTFERLSAQMRAGGVRSQALLVPAPLELAPARAAMVTAGLAELRAIGFELEPFGPATLLLKGVPAEFGADGGMGLLTDLLDSLGEGGLHPRGAGAFEDLLKRLACHGSVRVGRVLAPDEIAALLAALDATAFKSNCPHGRPVHIRFARNQIERLFRR